MNIDYPATIIKLRARGFVYIRTFCKIQQFCSRNPSTILVKSAIIYEKGVKMREFDYKRLVNCKWDSTIIEYLVKIHEMKGRQELYLSQKKLELDRLVEIAKIQSTEASNAIEGIGTTETRLKQLNVSRMFYSEKRHKK